MRQQDRVGSDPNACDGKTWIQATRELVSVILADVAGSESFEAIVPGFHAELEDVRLALFLVAHLTQNR